MKDFRISNEHRPGETGEITGFIERPRIWVPSTVDYPDYDYWLDKVGEQLETEQKRAMVAYYGGEIVGALIYQRHPKKSNVLELKNLSVSPTHNGRYVGSFLLRNTEIEGTQHDFPGCDTIVFDTKSSNAAIIGFAMSHDYKFQGIEDLYGLKAGEDAFFSKSMPNSAG